MKINLGSGNKKLEGFTNVDVQDWDGNTDIVCDFVKDKLPFEDNSIEEVVCEEVLEHIPFRFAGQVIAEVFRILKPMGKFTVQVPDAGKCMEYYVNNEICKCVPHKSPDWEFNADPLCPHCAGKGKINPQRWLFTFTGAQKHPWDSHLNIFTDKSLKDLLFRYGFNIVRREHNIYKIIYIATK